MSSTQPPSVAVARRAMATRFEIVLPGDNPVRLRAAGEEALDEIERLESQLSLYLPSSEVYHLNQSAAAGPVRVTPAVFKLLRDARRIWEETAGAFDITVGPLMRVWGFVGGTGRLPAPADVEAAKARVGMNLVQLNETDCTVRFAREGVMIDLGAIGKGYALERAVELLREAGITSALLHGGTSTVCTIGAPPDAAAWKIAIEHPANADRQGTPLEPLPPLAAVLLKDEAMSVSAVWGKSFEADGKIYGHVIDPRTGAPTQGASFAAVVLPSATETDALSTALLTLGLAGHDQIVRLRPGMRSLVAALGHDRGGLRVESRNIVVNEMHEG